MINFLDREHYFKYRRLKRRVLRLREKGIKDDRKLPYFNLEYLRIDMIITIKKKNFTIMYYIKWSGQPYDKSTWEQEKYICRCEGFIGAKHLFKLQEKTPSKQLNENFYVKECRRGQKLNLNEDKIYKNGHKLKKTYQIDGREWLIHNYHNYIPCILADEMGLGKTVQTISFIEYLVNSKNIPGPFLIIAPLSTLSHWKREFRGWTDLNVVIYHGNEAARKIIKQYNFTWTTKNKTDYKLKFNVLITTNQIALKQHHILQPIAWECIIIDEAHCLKNLNAALYKRLNTYHRKHCIFLTGTPIQNNMKELFALLHFLDPVLFDSEKKFLNQFGEKNLSETSNELREKFLNPRLLQRNKTVVEPKILGREEKIIWVEMTLLQKKWYKALYEQNYSKLAKLGGEIATKTNLINISMELRKCCNHPFLIKGCEESISPVKTTLNHIAFQNLISASGKFVLLDKLLPKLKREGRRILLFSQMSKILDIIEEYLRGRGHHLERIDGSVTGNNRQETIDRYLIFKLMSFFA